MLVAGLVGKAASWDAVRVVPPIVTLVKPSAAERLMDPDTVSELSVPLVSPAS